MLRPQRQRSVSLHGNRNLRKCLVKIFLGRRLSGRPDRQGKHRTPVEVTGKTAFAFTTDELAFPNQSRHPYARIMYSHTEL